MAVAECLPGAVWLSERQDGRRGDFKPALATGVRDVGGGEDAALNWSQSKPRLIDEITPVLRQRLESV